jgi:stage IV sporulation protein FB
VTIFTVGGTRFAVNWLLLLLLGVLLLLQKTEETLILMGALVLHELAHLVVAWLLGVGFQKIELTPVGGVAQADGSLELDPQVETTVALAGPFGSFMLGAACLLLANYEEYAPVAAFGFQANLALACFNLLPALPLDGGRALRGLLAQRFGYVRATALLAAIGRVCGLGMLLAGLWALAEGTVYPTLLCGGVYLYWAAGREQTDAALRSYHQFLQKRSRMRRQRVVHLEQLACTEETPLREVVHRLSHRYYHTIVVLDQHLRPWAELYELDIMQAFGRHGPEATLGFVVRERKGGRNGLVWRA